MHWDDILREVLNKRKSKVEKKPQALHVDKKTKQEKHEESVNKVYYLGDEYPGVYFTRREAECVAGVLNGQSLVEIAERLQISFRTVDFYLKNAKKRLGCQRRSEMLAKVAHSSLMYNKELFG